MVLRSNTMLWFNWILLLAVKFSCLLLHLSRRSYEKLIISALIAIVFVFVHVVRKRLLKIYVRICYQLIVVDFFPWILWCIWFRLNIRQFFREGFHTFLQQIQSVIVVWNIHVRGCSLVHLLEGKFGVPFENLTEEHVVSVVEWYDLENLPTVLDGLLPIEKRLHWHIADERSDCLEVYAFLLAVYVFWQNERTVAHESVHYVKVVVLHV